MPLPIVNLKLVISKVTCREVTFERQRHVIILKLGMFKLLLRQSKYLSWSLSVGLTNIA